MVFLPLICTEAATLGLSLEWMSCLSISQKGTRGVLSRDDSMSKGVVVWKKWCLKETIENTVLGEKGEGAARDD